MSETPPPTVAQGASRRREERREVRTHTSLEVTSPAWAINPEGISGISENLTTNGMKINLDGFSSQVAQRWTQSIESYERLLVRVTLLTRPKPIIISGQIAWFYSEPTSEPEIVAASVGILFGVLREDEMGSLRGLLQSLETRFD